LESVSDTGLLSPLAATQKTTTKLISGNSILAVHQLLSTEANGEDLVEFELSSGTTNSLTRKTTILLEKTANKEVLTTTTLYADYN
jgi:hypothetical protein